MKCPICGHERDERLEYFFNLPWLMYYAQAYVDLMRQVEEAKKISDPKEAIAKMADLLIILKKKVKSLKKMEKQLQEDEKITRLLTHK